MALLSLPSHPAAADGSHRARAIATAKRVNVHTLDKALPPQKFAMWFRRVVGNDAKITWTVNDCGEGSAGPGADQEDWPMCAEATALVGEAEVIVSIGVGTFETGVHDAPTLFWAVVNHDRKMSDTTKLSELPALIHRYQ